jgi:hypothetical protein
MYQGDEFERNQAFVATLRRLPPDWGERLHRS